MFYHESIMALQMGMTSEQYWDDDPRLLETFACLYKRQLERDASELDALGWYVGMYVTYAIANQFGGGKGHRRPKYPEKPISFSKKPTKPLSDEAQVMQSYNNFLAAVHNAGFTIEQAASE